MPRIKMLKCHKCGRWFYPSSWYEEDGDGNYYCSDDCWREEMHEQAMADMADREYDEWWNATHGL